MPRQHGVPHGEKSSMGAANGSPGTPGYKGRHRAEDKSQVKGIRVGDPKRGENPGQDYER